MRSGLGVAEEVGWEARKGQDRTGQVGCWGRGGGDGEEVDT